MTAQAPGLAEMNARMNQWMAEKPQGNFNNTTELRLNQNDVVIFQFAASGTDGDRLIKAYRSHIFGLVSKNNKRYNEARYCPVQNGDGQECPWCAALTSGALAAGTGDLKERMSMWLLVHQILHASMPQLRQGETMPDWPIVAYEGSNYYMETVNAWKVWHTSAWKESPWQDICRTASMYGSLHAFTAQILCTGAERNKRFKFYVLPNSAALPREYYEQAYNQLTPIPDMLREESNRNLTQNPQPTTALFSAVQPIANNFIPGGVGSPASVPSFQPVSAPAVFQPAAAPAPAFTLPTAAPAAPLPVPMTVGAPPPLAVAAPAQPAVFQPAAAPAPFQPGAQPAVASVPGGDVPPPAPVAPAAPEPAPQAPPAPVQAPVAVAAPVAPPQAAAPPVAPPAAPVAPSIPPQAPALPATPPPAPTAAPVGQVQQAPDDGRRPMRRMF